MTFNPFLKSEAVYIDISPPHPPLLHKGGGWGGEISNPLKMDS
jgi:hypothetical protein